ncbi:MAG: ABC transporter substrate-binding protein [Kofleriaceae bacterium]
MPGRCVSLALALAVVGACADDARLASPWVGRGAAGDRSPDALVVVRGTDATDLDPLRASDDASLEVVEQIFEGLVRWRPGTTELEPALAAAWDVDATGLRWRFRLRRGVRFHDGTPVDAAAVAASLPARRRRRPAAPAWAPAGAVEAIVAGDDRTVELRSAAPPAGAARAAGVGGGGDRVADGLGPGRGGVRGATGGHRAVPLRAVGARRAPGLAAQRRLLGPAGAGPAPGVRDRARSAAAAGRARERRRRHRRRAAAGGAAVRRAAPRPRGAPRRAPRAAPPRGALGRRAARGAAAATSGVAGGAARVAGALRVPSTGAPTTASLASDAGSLDALAHDPARAEALVAEAAADGVELQTPLRLLVPAAPSPRMPEPQVLARAVAGALVAVGFAVEVVALDAAGYERARADGSYDLALAVSELRGIDPGRQLTARVDEVDARALAARLAALLDDAAASEPGARAELRAQVLSLVATEVPWIPLATVGLAYAARADLGALRVELDGHPTYAELAPGASP